MTDQERLAQIENQITNIRRLLWNASQTRRATGVFRLQAELDRLVDAKYALLRKG